MGVLKKSDIKDPVLPKETVEVPSLGGDLVVCGLLLKDRLALLQNKSENQALVSVLLAATVRDAEGKQVFTVEEWETFGATKERFIDVTNLFQVARRLSGLDTEVAQKK